MNYRERVESGDLTTERVRETADETGMDLYEEWFAHELSGENRAVVEESIERLENGEYESAIEVLRGRFESVCERQRPVLQHESHPAACHLYEQPESEGETRRTGPIRTADADVRSEAD